MADNSIKILIEAQNKASKELNAVKKELDGLKKATKDTGAEGGKSVGGLLQQFSGLKTGIVGHLALATSAIVAFKKVMDLSREGAQLDLTAGKFERLAKSVGSSANAMLGDLRDATRGTVADFDLMASATDFMALGLAKSHEEVVRLTRVAGALGMNMNQLVLTLTNQTTMRFDALGVKVDGFKEKVKALEDAGMSANEAFQEAFLQQAEEQIGTVGEVADTAAGAFMRFDAQAKNLFDRFKREAGKTFAPFVEDMADALEGNNRIQSILDRAKSYGIDNKMRSAVDGQTARTYADIVKEVIAYEAAIDQTAESMIEYAIAAAKAGDEQEHIARTAEDAKKELDNMGEVLGFITDAMDKYGVEVAEGSYLHEELTSRLSGLTEKQQAAKTAAEELTLAYQNGTIDMFQYADAANALVDAFEDGILTAFELADMLDKLPREVRTDYYITVHGYQQVQQMMSSQYGGVNPGAGEPGTGGPQAAGGIVHAAAGAFGKQAYYVGEIGPETFFPAQDGRILSNSETKAALRSGRGGGETINVTINTPVNFADKAFVERELAPYIKSVMKDALRT